MAECLIQYPLGVGGVTTRVLQAGQGPRTLVFVHGLSTRADRWSGNVQALATPGWRCITFDLPGHGLADKPEGFDYSVRGLASYLGGVLDALEVKRCAIVSTSLGSHVAGWFAVHSPQRVAAHMIVAGLGLVPIAEETGQGIRRSVRDTSREGVREEAAISYLTLTRPPTPPRRWSRRSGAATTPPARWGRCRRSATTWRSA